MIDRIGKGGAPPPAAGPTGPTQTEKTGKTFDVHKSEQARPPEATEQISSVATNPLDQLKAGKIDFDGYLDLKVNEATSHLEGLAPAQIDSIRSMLRERMATDPELVDLVKQATGRAPSVPEE